MYEEKTRKIQINWKSLLIKLAILLVVIFLVVWIVSLFNRDKENASNFGTNLATMRDAATEYFTGSRLPSEANDSTRITLGEMFDRNLLVEFQDENGNPCDTEESYAEATKIDEENYRIEVRLVCENDSDTIINTVKRQVTDSDNNVTDDEGNDPIIDDDTNDDIIDDNEDSSDQTNQGSSNNQGSNQSGSNNSGSNSNSNNNSNNNNSNSSNNNNGNNNHNNGNNNTNSNTCTYGKKEYATTYPLAYVVSGNCAVSTSSISGSHANSATKVGNAEYTKLVKETANLEANTGANLVVSNPQYTKILNKAGTGYVGYQIYFSVKQKINSYATKTIYSYYLDQNGNRKVIIDNRSSLDNSNNNENQIHVTSVTINRSSLTLDVGDTYTLSATVKPTNATNKTVSWSSSNTSVVSVSSNGKVTAKGEGRATITATADGKKDTVTVKVNDDGYIEFEESKVTLDVGDTYRIDYDTNLSGKVSWSSSNTKVATVSSSGRITAKKEGTATITATINGKSDTIRVTVEEEGYLRILDDDYLVVFVGNSYTLDVDTNLDDLTFQSSDTSIATVNSNGTIRVKKVGGVTITVRSGKYQDTIRIYCQELSFFD